MAKKPRRSAAWKSAERHAARAICGYRISRGSNYGKSLPDATSARFVAESKYGKQTAPLGWMIRALDEIDEGHRKKVLFQYSVHLFSRQGLALLLSAFKQADSYPEPTGWDMPHPAPRVVFFKPPRMVGGIVAMRVDDFLHLQECSGPSEEFIHPSLRMYIALGGTDGIGRDPVDWSNDLAAELGRLRVKPGTFKKRSRPAMLVVAAATNQDFVVWRLRDHLDLMRSAGFDVDAPGIGKVRE